MTVDTLIFKEVLILPELFLGISVIYLILHGTFLTVKKEFPLFSKSMVSLGILALSMTFFLLINENLFVTEQTVLNNTVAVDYVSFISKSVVCIISIFCFILMSNYLVHQQINNFEYIVLVLLSVLGLLILCCSNDLITAYLAIELQSLSFYVLAASKKNSSFSVDAGMKYFILGSFSSSLFLFGSSLLYGITGSLNFEDFKDLFFWVSPGIGVYSSDYISFRNEQDEKVLMHAFMMKLCECVERYVTPDELHLLANENTNIGAILNDDEVCGFYRFVAVAFSVILSLTFPIEYLEELPIDQGPELTKAEGEFTDCMGVILDQFDELIKEFGDCIECGDPGMRAEIMSRSFRSIDNMALMFTVADDYQTFTTFNSSFDHELVKFSLILIMVSLLFKLAVAPFHLWSPDVYEGSPTSSSLMFAVVPKIAIFVLMYRIYYYGFFGFIENWRFILSGIALISLIVGSFGGLEQRKIKSLLAFSSISHMGYVLLAFCSGSLEGLQMMFCYLIIYTISSLSVWSIFFTTRLRNRFVLKQNKDLADLTLLAKSNKMLALYFSIVLFSMAGFPPMIGFLVKVGIFLSAIESSMYFLAFFSILCSVVSTFYYLRLIKVVYFEPVLVGRLYYPVSGVKATLVSFISFLFIFLFINPTFLFLCSYKISILSLF